MSSFQEQSLLIDAPAGVLEVQMILQSGERSTKDNLAIICHPNPTQGGTMSNKVVSTLYRYCRDVGMDVLRFNFRGVGRSTGRVGTGDGEFLDALTVLKFALTQTKARRLWLAGFSFGGYVACRVADYLKHAEDLTDVHLRNLVLIAPSVLRAGIHDLTWHTDHAFMIYGDQDELVPPNAMQNFAEQHHMPTTVIETGHFFHAKLVELRQALEFHTLI